MAGLPTAFSDNDGDYVFTLTFITIPFELLCVFISIQDYFF